MRKVQRIGLQPATVRLLARKQSVVQQAANPKAVAYSLWRRPPKAAFRDIRAALTTMAHGRARCMYCEDSAGTDIDHFYPKSLYPLRTFSWDNYLSACSFCNSNCKRASDPLTSFGNRILLDPSIDDPADHLDFVPSTGEFLSRSQIGQSSIAVFGLNDCTAPRRLPHGRKGTFIKLQLLLQAYDHEHAIGRADQAELIRSVVVDEPFSAVLGWLVRAAASEGAAYVLAPEIPAIVARHAVANW